MTQPMSTPSSNIGHMGHQAVFGEFFDDADLLRRAYDAHFDDRISLRADRFVWDYWYVPEFFTYLRALPQSIFPESVLEAFLARLLSFGRKELGCRRVLLPTVNCHIDGCWHNFHTDADKGPWAYVYSLTHWETRRFAGGQTVVLNPAILDYWRTSESGGNEPLPLFNVIEPEYNQLCVFDARLPHSVNRVGDTHDPQQGRVTMAGWFTEPGLVVSDIVEREGLVGPFEACAAELGAQCRAWRDVTGTLVAHMTVGRDGVVTRAAAGFDTLVPTGGDAGIARAVGQVVHDTLAGQRFPPMPEEVWATIPLQFPIP
jgi:hypothetical protein